ncbi:MAG: hypothetical protein R2697_10610 [Ilumatobacteraceae bacterium]
MFLERYFTIVGLLRDPDDFALVAERYLTTAHERGSSTWSSTCRRPVTSSRTARSGHRSTMGSSTDADARRR